MDKIEAISWISVLIWFFYVIIFGDHFLDNEFTLLLSQCSFLCRYPLLFVTFPFLHAPPSLVVLPVDDREWHHRTNTVEKLK
ncbi:hypothetical protein RJT34_10736 [Clitoria ternatea]|uniref:Uncharacterized protein n=1 Tax=Clitoria ternatea TaxID=43366 RepID=A0AAN9JIR0_CLITE